MVHQPRSLCIQELTGITLRQTLAVLAIKHVRTRIPEGGLLLLPAEEGQEHEHDRSKQGQQIHPPAIKQAGRAEHRSPPGQKESI